MEQMKIGWVSNDLTKVKVEFQGNVIIVTDMNHRNTREPTIKMLPGGKYQNLLNGEIYDCATSADSRADHKRSLQRTFEKIRGLINTNVTDPSRVRWCTLTYEENMTDAEQLYHDFRKFWQRFKYYCRKHDYGKPEYIVMMEPQGRGAWHAHLLIIWTDRIAPYIPNSDLAEVWKHGFVKIKALKDVDNVGAYLTAYLGDMELDKIIENGVDLDLKSLKGVKDVEVSEDGKKVPKRIIKGARLNVYPSNFQMYRCSDGIKRPLEKMIPLGEVKKMVSTYAKTYEYSKSIPLVSKDGTDNQLLIHKEYYNTIRKKDTICVTNIHKSSEFVDK